ncbi:hypothetical protein B0H16DRAFT_1877750 [Mycena metata]|uniref:Uncharacterized protein n=1 Tax=Mycena metata TaxID=1033252 RepID=A0AAD7NZ01_9AGAR|nr:hypothetical protein B0H16DRAFT_1877750 [Mycena metata]
MPPVRRKETRKTLDLSQQLCNALGFRDRKRMCKEMKKRLQKRVDQYFDLRLPASEQPGNMRRYLAAIAADFPGYFNNKHERLNKLEEYIVSYLDDNRSSLPLGDVIKVRRPSRRNSQTKNVPVVFVFGPAAPIEPPPAPSMDLDPPDDDSSDDEDDDDSDDNDNDNDNDKENDNLNNNDDDNDTPAPEVEMGDPPVPEVADTVSDRGRGSSLVPEFSPPPSPPGPPSIHSESDDLDPQSLDPVDSFLETCTPSMSHCAAALKRMGVTTHEDLLGMARWSEERLREVLKRQEIPQKVLDEEALIIGFSACLLFQS